MSAQNKAKIIDTLVAFLGTTSGRDKSCRTLQYFSRFIKAVFLHLALVKANKAQTFTELAEKVDALGGSMGMTRKVLRFGRPIGIIKNVFVLLRTLAKKDKQESQGFWYTYFKAIGDISLALFFLFDHVLYLGRLKIVKNQAVIAKCDYFSNFFWLSECLATIVADCLQIHVLQNKLAQESLSRQKTIEEINQLKEKIDNSILNIVRSIIDIPIAIHFMNPKFLEPGFVGILGTITSLIGCVQAWPKK